jgi:type IV pilus assembly protein PilM
MTATDVIFSVSSSKIATKEVTTPIMKEKQLVDMIEANANEYFPIYLEDYILAHNILDKGNPKKGFKQMRVLVMAAPKDLVDDYYKLAERLRLNVKSIDYAGNSAYQMIRRQIGPETSLVIQIQEESTTVNILKDNILKLQRTIPYGKNLPIEALSRNLKIDEEEAATLLETERYIHETFDGDPVTESLKHLINNVLRVVDYYNSRNTDEPVEKAYLIGESVSLLGVDFLFANEFDVSVIQLTRFHGVKLETENELLHRIVTKYVGCLGAGIAPVNFVPKETLEKLQAGRNFRWLKLGVLAAIIVAVVAIAIPVTQMVVAETEKDSVQKDIDRIKDIESVVNNYYNSKDLYKDALAFKNQTEGNNDSVLGFIEALEDVMPSDISIKSISFVNGAISISAVTSTKETIAKFIVELEKISNVSGVFVSSLSESKDDEGVITTMFSLTCQLSKIADEITLLQYVLENANIDFNQLLQDVASDGTGINSDKILEAIKKATGMQEEEEEETEEGSGEQPSNENMENTEGNEE